MSYRQKFGAASNATWQSCRTAAYEKQQRKKQMTEGLVAGRNASEQIKVSDPMRRAFNPSGNRDVDEIKRLGNELHSAIESLPPSREASVAKTELETACMWAVKAATK